MCWKLVDVWNVIDSEGNWDDLMEHQPEDLVNKFNVSEEDADILWMVIQSRTDPRRDTYRMDAEVFGQAYLTTIHEALHQGLDVWTDAQRLVIQAFLSGIAWSVNMEAQGRSHEQSTFPPIMG
jgi:hypothetical protein